MDMFNKNLIKIGSLTSQSKFTTSKFADENMFFKHEWMEHDFALRPEWLNDIKRNGDISLITGTPNCSAQIPNEKCD